MAIDYAREEELDENGNPVREQRASQPNPARRAVQKKVAGVVGRGVAHAVVDEVKRQGAAAAGIPTPSSFGEEAGPGAIGGILQIAEAAEEGLDSSAVEDRMRKYPELRDVEVLSGREARFPEFAETAAGAKQKSDPDDELGR